ncbi:hypothetical protein ACKTEK_03220 [Tepidamorphus sp. 3E244]|uniref:hypothetical protein n=1 Tax=Tepidamorphus sp. 3E244 TaxID=3385498 RepID=UPI0038FC8EAF
MIKTPVISLALVAALLVLAPLGAEAHSFAPFGGGVHTRAAEKQVERATRAPSLPGRAARVEQANAGCGAAIARVEAQTGGRVISANLVGGNRCRLVVLVPSRNRSRPPTPQTIVVPAG